MGLFLLLIAAATTGPGTGPTLFLVDVERIEGVLDSWDVEALATPGAPGFDSVSIDAEGY